MRDLFPEARGPMGGEGKIVEANETFIGCKERNKHANKKLKVGRGWTGKDIVFSLGERAAVSIRRRSGA